MTKAVRRLGCERMSNAIEGLESGPRAEGIHDARKEIKRTRALLRLVRTGISRTDYRRVITTLREAANHLAPSRDAAVREQTLERLAQDPAGKSRFSPDDLRGVRTALEQVAIEEAARFDRSGLAEVTKPLLHDVACQFERLEVKGKGFEVLGPGIQSVYTRGRSAYQVALEDPSPENLHEWRKRAKDLWYQLSLLEPMAPTRLEAMTGELDKLGEFLGDDHDLFMLLEGAEAHCAVDGSARELEALTALVEQRHEELRRAALALGARLYSNKPAAFCDQLEALWKAWRSRKKADEEPAVMKP